MPFSENCSRDPTGSEPRTPGGDREVSRLPSGSFRLDYDDEDHVFVLTLQQVPRRRLGPDTPVRVGRIDDLEVDLNAVIVDTGIHVDLSIRDSPRRDALLLEFQADFDSWAALRDRDAE